jgi:hypothetical protein
MTQVTKAFVAARLASMTGAESSSVTWTAILTAIGGIATPIVVVMAGVVINNRVRALEDKRWHNQELIRTRLGYYDSLASQLNDLLCYFTFIGSWKKMSPLDVIDKKRSLDKQFYVAAPLFSHAARDAYVAFMNRCFGDYGEWGHDALLLTAYQNRRQYFPGTWHESWESMFAYSAGREVSPAEIKAVWSAYNQVLATLVLDIDLVAPRQEYSDSRAVVNAR